MFRQNCVEKKLDCVLLSQKMFLVFQFQLYLGWIVMHLNWFYFNLNVKLMGLVTVYIHTTYIYIS